MIEVSQKTLELLMVYGDDLDMGDAAWILRQNLQCFSVGGILATTKDIVEDLTANSENSSGRNQG